MFELQVGDRTSPQRLLVTVETEAQEQQNPVGSNAKRKLFQQPVTTSSTPARRLRGQTTTTTIPLRESIEEEGGDAATPKPRGRQRKSNGTPMPSAGTKRRAATPVRRTPRRPRTTTSVDGEEPSSEASEAASVQATPTPRRRNLRPRKTPSAGPTPVISSEAAADNTPRASTVRRGRRRRQALAPDELLELADEVGDINLDTTQLPPVTSEDEVDLVKAPSDSTDDESSDATDTVPAVASVAPSSPSPNYTPAGAVAEPDSDIWIGNMSNEATPRAATQTRRDVIPESSPRFPPTTFTEQQPDPDVETSQAGDYGDYGYGELGAAASDRSSIDEPLGDEEPTTTTGPAAYDTIAQGEDFSMIFMDSIPSLQADFNSSVHPIVHEELGEETSMLINNTLESLRQEAEAEVSHEDDDAVDAIEPAEEEVAEEPAVERETTPVRQSSSPHRPSPSWSRSPRKTTNSSPLRHRVLKQNAWQTGESAIAQQMRDAEPQSLPAADRHLRNEDIAEQDVSNLYEDSFSEIPEAVLAAATPRRPQVSITYDDLEDEVDQVEMIDENGDEMSDEELHQDDELVEEVEEQVDASAADEEQDIRYPELPQQVMEFEDDEAEESDELHGEDAKGLEAEDSLEGVGDDSADEDENHELRVIQDEEQEDEGVEEEDEEEALLEQESESESESELEPVQESLKEPVQHPEPQQAVPLEVNYEQEQEDGYEEDDEDMNDIEPSESDLGQEVAETEQMTGARQQDGDDSEEELEESETEQEDDMQDDLVVPTQPPEQDENYLDEEDMDQEADEEDDMEEDLVVPTQMPEDDENYLDEEMDQEGEEEEVSGDNAAAASVASTTAPSDPTRLPTPDHTPPQADFQIADDTAVKSIHGSRPPSRLRSSPRSPEQTQNVPRITVELPQEAEQLQEEPEDEEMEQEEDPEESLFVQDSQHEALTAGASRPSLDATPPHQISSPVQEPLSLQHEALLDKTLRPHLSTIIRAGRVLQSITSDPPSPEGREKQLGSPFRRSGSKDSWSGSRDSQTSRRMSRSPLQARSAAPTSVKMDSPAQHEGPGSGSGAVRYPSFLSPVRRSKEPSVERHRSPSRHSPASSMHITPPSDGALSWVEREGPISPSLRGDNSLREAAGLPDVGVRKPGTVAAADTTVEKPVAEPPRELSPVVSKEPEPEPEQDARDDDTDIWELEAQRETPRSVRQQPFGKRVATSNNRRGAIPSPWTKRSVHRPAISRMISQAVPDLSHLTEEPSVMPDQPPQSSSPDEYSRLAQSQKEEAAAKNVSNAPESAAKASKLDLSSFFSSPATIPGMLAQKLMPAKTQPAAQLGVPSMAMAAQAPPVVPTSSMFPQIPQKEFRPDSSNRSSLFSPVRRRQPSAPQQQKQASPEEAPTPQKQPDPPAERSSSPATPEQILMPAVSQKQNFTPRPRQASNSFFQPSSNPSAAVTPPRMQLSHADIHRWTQQTSNASEASSDFQRPLLRPLPPKNASPTKSSLRSPLKPHTPGRVVEFTSSVLSPAEQAKARHDQRSSHSNSILSQDFFAAPSTTLPNVQDDKENASIDDISMEDAPPLTKPPPPEPLSQTIWSRQHWLLLDELLQYRRSSPYPVNYAHRAEQYLGKTVKSHGEAMTLERWHIDVVDAFKGEVGGWDEGALVKRLFALILGEERRTQAREVVERRVMFH